MKRKVFILLFIFGLSFMAACSLFKKFPSKNNVEHSETNSVSWDDSQYDYDSEFNGQISKNTSNTNDYITDNKFIERYSDVLGFNIGNIKNKDLIIESASWIGTKYKYGFAQKQVGTDCSGFVKSVIKTVYNVELFRTAVSMAEETKKINQNELEEGDLVFFSIGGKNISHVGIYLCNNYFIHASTSNGVMVSNLNEKYYSKYFVRGGKLKK